ncbi:MAG: hypothetical protein J6R18_10100 [Kiritimatiellae bacterium]|nr:hypothetical protein [Kiritimatiellia bacterium]
MSLFAKKAVCSILCAVASFAAFADVVAVDGKTVRVDTLDDLKAALEMNSVEIIVLANCITLPDGTDLTGYVEGGKKKTVQVENPFLPEDGRVRIHPDGDNTYIVEPVAGSYSTTNLFLIKEGAKVKLSYLTLMGGFAGSRTVTETPSVGGIDNYGHLEMEHVDMLRTGTALLNRPKARALLISCNIVRNANWYGGGILNFSERKGTTDEYINGGVLVMDNCSLTENESLGPAHGGGAAENQGTMCLNNCVVANNASTEIGGGINNCKGGKLFVMNSTFTGNITTSEDYGTMAGGAIGNAGGASHVHIVNSILAYNGYDDGESVVSSSLGRYKEDNEVHSTMQHSVYDAISGLPQIDTTGTTTEYARLFSSVQSFGIIAAGSTATDGKTSAFDHPLVETKTDDTWALSPIMLAQPENHYIFRNSVETYFDYSGLFSDPMKIGMAYKEDGVLKKLGEDMSIPENPEDHKVVEGFGGASRDSNFIGAVGVIVQQAEENVEDITLFTVQLGEFTGGHVSGVTIYKDSYRSNSVVTVHGTPDSAHYLDGWEINGKLVPDSVQQYIFSFTVVTNIIITPRFFPVETKIIRVRQRYPWNNLVDIDYSVSEKDAVEYRLVFIATYTDENGVEKSLQLKSFVKNSGRNSQGQFEEQQLGWKHDLRKAGEHRVTWDSAKDGVRIKNRPIALRLLACEGDER